MISIHCPQKRDFLTDKQRSKEADNSMWRRCLRIMRSFWLLFDPPPWGCAGGFLKVGWWVWGSGQGSGETQQFASPLACRFKQVTMTCFYISAVLLSVLSIAFGNDVNLPEWLYRAWLGCYDGVHFSIFGTAPFNQGVSISTFILAITLPWEELILFFW